MHPARYPDGMPSGLDAASTAQVDAVTRLLLDVLGADAVAAFLYGSAVVGGLKPASDLDFFAVSARSTTPSQKRRLIDRLTAMSGTKATGRPARHLEVTIAAHPDVRPWRYPPRLDFQYGDWFRAQFENGDLSPWRSPDPDLAVLVTTVRRDGLRLFGPPPADVLDAVPRADLDRAMLDCLPGLLVDLEDDTRNILLTLARIWMTLATGDIRPKDVAADWALQRLPEAHRVALASARDIYLGDRAERWDDLMPVARHDANVILAEIESFADDRSV